MAEPFKNMFREETVRQLAEALASAGEFDADSFVEDALAGLDDLELKDRVRHLSSTLKQHLNADYGASVDHMLRALPPPLCEARAVTSGFIVWPLCQFVEDHGLDDPEVSLPALYQLTKRFSAEFAIRPFILRYPDTTLGLLMQWTEDPDQHVRRLVSEGTRPRLPWGLRLQPFVEDPAPILPLLEKLRDDPEEYVRRSVANNLNDIAKDNPEVVVDACRKWQAEASKTRDKLIRHALRSLIKNGHPGALELLGFGPPEINILRFNGPATCGIGTSAELALDLRSLAKNEQKLVIDYALHFPAARGGFNRKVFKWCTRTLGPGEDLHTTHRHSFKPVSTRKTRPGEHRFELFVNGRSTAEHHLSLEDSNDA